MKISVKKHDFNGIKTPHYLGCHPDQEDLWLHYTALSDYCIHLSECLTQDASVSYDWTTNTSDPLPHERDNHGTECAGVIAMSKNSRCGVGVAFDSNIGGI